MSCVTVWRNIVHSLTLHLPWLLDAHLTAEVHHPQQGPASSSVLNICSLAGNNWLTATLCANWSQTSGHLWCHGEIYLVSCQTAKQHKGKVSATQDSKGQYKDEKEKWSVGTRPRSIHRQVSTSLRKGITKHGLQLQVLCILPRWAYGYRNVTVQGKLGGPRERQLELEEKATVFDRMLTVFFYYSICCCFFF